MTDQITPKQFHEAEGVADWRVVGDGACAYFRTGSLAAGARLVQAISGLPGVEDHSPDVDVRGDGVTVRLITYTDDYYGMSRRDIELARQISAAARKLGLSADPSAVQSVLVIPGASAPATVLPFWRAVLGYEHRRDNLSEDLVDPHGRGPAFWFERMDEPLPGRPRRGPHRDLGAVRAGGGSHRGSARRRRPDGARYVRAVMVDAGRCGGQRG
jgi:4a-hydroxytetrahydrobiopterin dehydratase